MDDKDATVTVRLRADSGYQSDEVHRISPDPWGKIMGVLHAPEDCSQCGKNPADEKGGLCVACNAYQDHTA